MLITKLTLHLSKRMGFNGIKTFTYEPAHIYQIVLGTNGSGKSSLMNELSPLPASGNDYFKGGYKEIELTHQGKRYTLLSDFASKKAGHHSFICDDIELNEGGTQAVQRQIVKEHFDFDKDLFELLTGQTSFREMSPNQRRYWLVRMADDNMEYAISLYNYTKKRHRDAGVVVKYLDEQITEVKKQFPNIEQTVLELKEREDKLKQLHKTLSKIDGVESSVTVKQLAEYIGRGFEKLTHLTHEIQNLPKPVNFQLSSPDMIPNIKVQVETSIEQLTRQINDLTEEHAEVKQTVKTLVNQEADNVGMLQEALDKATATKEQYLAKIMRFKSITQHDAVSLSNHADLVADSLETALAELPDNTNQYFNRSDMQSKREVRETLAHQVNNFNVELNRLEHTIRHLEDGDKVDCPKCNNRFVPGMSNYNLEELIEQREKTGRQRDEVSKRVEEIDEYLRAISDYSMKYRKLKDIMSANPTLKPLWDSYTDHPLTEYPPNKYIVLFNLFTDEVANYLEASKLQSNIDEMTQAINAVKSKSGDSKEYSQGALDRIENKVQLLSIERSNLYTRLDTLREYERIYNEANRLSEEYKSTDKKLDALVHQYYDGVMQDFISREIDDVNRQLGSIAHELSSVNMASKNIEDLTKERARGVEQKELLDVLCNNLSPVNGLIADYSLKFITQFTDQMNVIINSIWTYDMQLQPLAISEDLTYKFPVVMSESDTQTPDINKLSTAQKRVVDFAFKILLITYLGLEDYPLYVDELTPNLDETHRINITNYLKTFVDSGRCSQLFMTSHYVSGHNAFRDAEFIVINNSNLLNVPDTYNLNATLEYEG